MPDEPTYYPDMPCHLAPLRDGSPAPLPGCGCRICAWAALREVDGPVKPGTPAWTALLAEATR